MSTGLQGALEALYGLERRRSDFRVEDEARLLDALGRPQDRFQAVHVAGTNGKGSACAVIERVLRAAGVRTGLTTSPHLVDWRERIRVEGRWLEEAELEARLDALQALDAARGRTFFEVTTALAFDAFARHEVAWAVVEVGLGGRLDATNVLDPAVTAITHVGLDHTEMLGTTLDAIAREKAGIAKPGRPLILGPLDELAATAARGVAAARGARWIDAGARVTVRDARPHRDGVALVLDAPPWGRLELGLALRGAHQVENARVALAVLGELAGNHVAIPAAAVREGFARVHWPGRLEPCPAEPRLWWDGAHNLDGVTRLVRAWRQDLALEAPAAIVVAAAHDKPHADMLAALRALAPDARLLATRTENARALPAEDLARHARAAGWNVAAFPDVAAAVTAALAEVHGTVLLVGSLFAVGEAMRAFGGAPGAEV